MIDTIFYFAPTKVEYESYQNGHEIDPRTVVFVAETGEIYKNGKLYGKMSESDFREMLEKIMQENPYVLPKATKYTGTQSDHIGGVMVGKYISVNTTNGVISVDAYELFNDTSVQQLVKNIIDAQYIKEGFTTKASYDQFGITKIKKQGGILVNGGIIQIDPDITNWDPKVINGLKGQDGVAPTISIGTDGYWYINGQNTGVKAKGDKGDKGDPGAAGSGISSIKYLVDIQSWYLLSDTNSGITTSSPGWTLSNLTPTLENRYLWRKDVYKYSDGTEVVKGPYLVGSIGEKGDKGDTGSGGGFDPETDTYILNTILPRVTYNYNFILDLIRGEITRIDQLVNAIDTEIKDRVTNMITDAQWILENFPENVIDHTDGWSEEMKAYLQRVGLWWEDGNGNVTTRWSDVLQRFESIEANVNTLIQDPEGKLTSLLAALSLFTDETTARATLDTFWARTNEMKDVITWMYSGLRNEASENTTWSDLISAAKGEDGGTAASNLHTGIERTLEGKFIAKGSLITELDGELREKIASGVLTLTNPNYSFANLFSDVQTNNRNFSDLQGQIDTIVDITDPLDAYVQQHMIAEACIYAVEMETKTVIVDGVAKTIDVPVYYSNPECTERDLVNKERNIYIKYIQDKNDQQLPLWIITDEGGYDYDEVHYDCGQIVTFNPHEHGEIKRVIKALHAAGFVTYADVKGAYALMFARDETGEIESKIETIILNKKSIIQVKADNIDLDGTTTFLTAIGQLLKADLAFINDLKVSERVLFKPDNTNWGLTTKMIDNYTALLIGDTTADSASWNINNPIDPKINVLLYSSATEGGALDTWSNDSHKRGHYGSGSSTLVYNETGLANYAVGSSVAVYETRIVDGGGVSITLKHASDSDQGNYSYSNPAIDISCETADSPRIRVIDPTDRTHFTEVYKNYVRVVSSSGETIINGGSITLRDTSDHTKTISATS